MKLGEILIQLGQITPEQLDAGLRAQELAGGRLGTHLVELGFIGTDQLSLALSRQMGVPAALERHFSRADPAVVAMLKASLAVRYLAVPLAVSRNGAKQVVAAMATPLDVLTVDDLSFALGARVEPLVAARDCDCPQHQAALRRGGEPQDARSLVMPVQTPAPASVQGAAAPHSHAAPTSAAARTSAARTLALSERATGTSRALAPSPSPPPARDLASPRGAPATPSASARPRPRG